MTDFLLELRCEEIPARMQAKARNDLARLFAEELEEAGISASAILTYSTPRRLALIAREVPLETPTVKVETKGPRVGAPEQALSGFLQKYGLQKDQLVERDGVYFAERLAAGRPTSNVLAFAIQRIVDRFPWPKSMRWGALSDSTSSLRWVRPLHSIVALLGDEIVPVAIDGVACGATTVGHRFHHPGQITVGGASDYAEKLRACHVIVDQDERERIIREGAQAVAAEAGLILLEDEGLVVENAGLTEWPVPLLGRFDPDFLDVPREVIVLTMRTNQKYFACLDQNADLAPALVCVANVSASDGGAAIVEGNRRVLAARLADARFFWEQDLKVPLEEQAKKLDQIVFHEKLGTIADKVERIEKLALWLVDQDIVKPVEESPQAKTELYNRVKASALYCKADLVTGMVGEFPELQGVIGGYLAEMQGESKEVAAAIRDHYKPVGQSDGVPTAPATVAVALADKLDTLASFFAIGEKPTGSKDPFALRRAALGLIRILVSNEVRISLADAVREARWRLIETVGRSMGILEFPDDLPWDDPVPQLPADRLYQAGGTIAVLSPDEEPQTTKHVGEVSYPAFSRDFLDGENVSHYLIGSIADVAGDTVLYLTDRIEESERSTGIRHDVIRAVVPKEYLTIDIANLFSDDVPRTRGPGVSRFRKRNWRSSDDPVEILARVRALQHFIATDDGGDLLTAYKRAANILKKENWTGPQVLSSPEEQGIPQTGEEDPLVLVDDPILKDAVAEIASGQAGADLPEEKALIAALDAAEPKAASAVEAEDFTAAMAALASLRGPIDDFFDHVTVNDPDPAKRERRLNLLMRFRDAVNQVADFSKIEG